MLQFTTDIALDALSLAAFGTSEDSRQILVKFTEMYDSVRYKKNQMAIDTDLDVLIEIIKDLNKSGTLDKKTEYNKIILKIKSSPLAQKDRMLTDNVADMLKQGMSQGISVKRELELRRKLQNWCLISATNETLLGGLSLCRKYNRNDENTNDLILANMLDKAHEITKIQETFIGATESIDELDFSSKSSMLDSANKYARKKKANVIKLGWQGLNRMLGINGGICRGELVGFAAPSYNGKSLVLMKIARWATVHNHYELNDPSKIPTILLISLENEVSDDYNDMSKDAYVNAQHRPVPPDMTKEELIDINYTYYNQCGNRLIVKRFGEDFGYADLLKLIARTEMRNMEIVCLIIDYPALMRQETNDKDNAAKTLERLFQKLLDLSHAKDIATVVGVQLERTAEHLLSKGEVCAVKKLTGDAIADAKGIKRALDVLIFQMIEVIDGLSYLTFAWNKHRNNNPPRTDDKFCAYRFDEMGILDDIGVKDTAIHDIYADAANVTKPKEEEKEKDDKDDFFSGIKAI